MVTRQAAGVGYEVSDSRTQTYHINLKASREAETASLESLVKERDDLGPELPNYTIPASLQLVSLSSCSGRTFFIV